MSIRPDPTIVGPWGPMKPRARVWAWLPPAERLLTLGSDPGSRTWALGASVIALAMVVLVIFLQQFTMGLRSQTLASAPPAVRTREQLDDPGISEFAIRSKLAVRIDHWAQKFAKGQEADPDDQVDTLETVTELEQMAVTRTDRVRLAAVVGELLGPAEALTRLEALDRELEAESALKSDVFWLRKIYRGGSALNEETRASLMDRHGWFGALAVSFGAPPSDPVRHQTVSGGERVAGFTLAMGGLTGISALASLVAAIGIGSMVVRRQCVAAFDPPEPGGSVYIETFAIFTFGFALLLLFTLVSFNVGAEGSTGALIVLEVMTWLLALLALWPVARGVQWKRILDDLGWNRGAGVFKEIGWGIAGYFAGILVTVIGGVIGNAIDAAVTPDAPESAGGYPLFEPGPGSSWWVLWLSVASATLWAPIVEESLFRGALYRHLRSRMSALLAIPISAVAFGLVHPYSAGGLISVALAGVVFALLREWRGSLIAPAVAHALHNGTISLMTVGLVAAAS